MTCTQKLLIFQGNSYLYIDRTGLDCAVFHVPANTV